MKVVVLGLVLRILRGLEDLHLVVGRMKNLGKIPVDCLLVRVVLEVAVMARD